MTNIEQEQFKSDGEKGEERVERQKKTLSKIGRSGLPFLIFGGWAGKIQGAYSADYYPRDIDIYINQKQLNDWQKFFETNNFSSQKEEDKIIFTDQETGASIDAHLMQDTSDSYVEKVSHGTFRLPKEAFETKEFEGSSITVMRPELSYIFEERRAEGTGTKERLEKLGKTINKEVLEEIREKFKYEKKVAKK